MYQEFIQYELRDSKMDINLLSQYQLIITIADTGIIFLVNDTKESKCLAIEKYKFPALATPENITISLQNIWDSHPFLNAGYWDSVVLLFSNLKFAYVPDTFSDESLNPEVFTRFNFRLASNEELLSHKINGLATTCYFAVNQEVINWFSTFYSKSITNVTHSSCAFLNGLQNLESQSDHLHFYISENIIALVNFKENQLNYLNCFSFKTPDDILYTCTLVIDELNLDRKEAKLQLWSDSNETELILQKLRAYYPEVVIGKRPSHLKFGFQFDELQEHQHFDLYNATNLF